MSPNERLATAYADLRAAVEALYYAAHWRPDRECAADLLWGDVKRAAGFKDGESSRRLGPPRPDGGIENARDAFLSLLADAVEFEEQPDCDVNDAGRPIDCTTYKIIADYRSFEELCEALGIKRARYDETMMKAIDRHLAPPAASSS